MDRQEPDSGCRAWVPPAAHVGAADPIIMARWVLVAEVLRRRTRLSGERVRMLVKALRCRRAAGIVDPELAGADDRGQGEEEDRPPGSAHVKARGERRAFQEGALGGLRLCCTVEHIISLGEFVLRPLYLGYCGHRWQCAGSHQKHVADHL